MLMLIILMLILMLVNLNTAYADADALLCIRICPCAVSAKEKLESLRNSKGVSSQRELEKENRALKRKTSGARFIKRPKFWT